MMSYLDSPSCLENSTSRKSTNEERKVGPKKAAEAVKIYFYGLNSPKDM